MASTQLRNLVYYHIDNELLDTANFLAGRLHALDPRNADASYLFALTYLRLRRYKPAIDISQKHGANGKHLACAYVFAQACLQLGRHLDGVQALERARPLWTGKSNWAKHTETSRRHQPDAVAVLTLLGKLWQAYGDSKRAGECYIEVQKVHPFTWEAFEGLCKANANLNIAQMFRNAPDLSPQATRTTDTQAQSFADPTISSQNALNQAQTSFSTPLQDPFTSTGPLHDHGSSNLIRPPGKSKAVRYNASSDWDTPISSTLTLSDEDNMAVDEDKFTDAPPAPRTRSDLGDQAIRRNVIQGLKRTISGHMPQALPPTSSDPPSNPRRSNRLFGQGTSIRSTRSGTAEPIAPAANKADTRPARVATGAKGRVGTTVGRVVSGNRKIMPPDPTDKEKEKLKRAPSRLGEKNAAGLNSQATNTSLKSQPSQNTIVTTEPSGSIEILDSLKRLAIGYYAASRFDLPQAIQSYKALPAAQRETPWVLAQLGKAHYEAGDYRAAEDCFARLMKAQPSRIEDLEVYSTVLWHLKKDTALALLCHSVRDQHYDAPQTWCVIGNSFSLAREHDQAIASFRRATQLDPNFAYAWVLMGHEYVANEEYDAALYAFRKGVGADGRGYGAWYGLGKSLERMGKYEDAERYYRIAAEINPSNATLLVCIGVVLEKLRNRKAALLQYARALQLAPESALARFKKARVLMHLKHFDQALVELEHLRGQAPDEANVWFLLGKCYKGIGDRGDALRAFTAALNLDAKASPFIREAMEALDDDDDDEDSEME